MYESEKVYESFASLERTKKRHEMKCDDFNRMHLDFYWPVDVIICAKWL